MSTSKMPEFKNARFWIWHKESWVKITLRPFTEISFTEYCQTDEGYCSSWDSFSHQGDHVLKSYSSEGRDCDGRFSSGGCLACSIEELNDPKIKHEQYTDFEVPLPKWREIASHQRDHSAEAMNY